MALVARNRTINLEREIKYFRFDYQIKHAKEANATQNLNK
jgi:hypothetical protein